LINPASKFQVSIVEIDPHGRESYKSKLTDVPLSEQELGLKDFSQNLEIPRLSNEEQASLEHDLTVQEIKNVLHSFEKNKTSDNKLRQFCFKVVHRIITTKKALLKYKLMTKVLSALIQIQLNTPFYIVKSQRNSFSKL
ncbi:unnamed protein product, partial [Porites evermanni]